MSEKCTSVSVTHAILLSVCQIEVFILVIIDFSIVALPCLKNDLHFITGRKI